jgi:Flp pilus assembly protein TadD
MKSTIDYSALALAARELLTQGDAVGAERVLAPVFNQLKLDPSVLHLMGLIKKAQNQLEDAERHFRSAIAYSLSEGSYYNELGVLLYMRGAFDEALKVYRAAASLTEGAPGVRVNIVNCLLAMGRLDEAEAEARAFIAAANVADGWLLLAEVQRKRDQAPAALESTAMAAKLAPKDRHVQYKYATALDRAGRAREALDVYDALASKGVDTPELALNYARSLYAADQRGEAEALAEKGVATWPNAVLLHGALARMRFLRGEGEKCTAHTEAQLAKRPGDLALRLACADALHRAKLYPRAHAILVEGLKLTPEAPALLTALGIILDELNRPVDGLQALRRAVHLTAGSRGAYRNLLSTLLRAGQPQDALQVARMLREAEPHEQFLIACEASALRMLGDPLYKSWCDYDRLVREYQLPAPQGFFTAESFNATLAGLLRPQHKSNAHPLDQYLPHGTQTDRSLLEWDERTIKIFMAAADAAVRDYIKRLEIDESHPLTSRLTRHYRYTGLWSVRLGQGGYQPSHVHDKGWISSAYYAALMPVERARDPRNGWLKFGEPSRPPAQCGPEKWVEPQVGKLVLFPSYFWHGTVPYEGNERLSTAFDVIPG